MREKRWNYLWYLWKGQPLWSSLMVHVSQQLAHKLGRGFDLKEEQELLEADSGGHGSNMRPSRDLQDSSADNEAQVIYRKSYTLKIYVLYRIILCVTSPNTHLAVNNQKVIRYIKEITICLRLLSNWLWISFFCSISGHQN